MTTAARIVEQALKALEIGRTVIVVTNETKAVLNTEKGRVVGFVKSSEPGNWRTAERRRQEEIRRALDADRVRRY
ncbi:hypothetical protein SEA_SHAWTY_38 [Streptomyces phage Shawty]|uniref:Uncharacterized protein n=1 Tax=Streptomyces phage Shawty TaxID=2510521 RepID=A0A411CYJ3_9CAUD|nr:hypothetical protein SEA_SHAWTY_38 [Streptomyces phage Shawty]